MDVVQYCFSDGEQRSAYGESGRHSDSAGGLCGSHTGRHVPGVSNGYTAEPECIDTDHHYRSGSGASNVPTITWNTPAAISYGTALSSYAIERDRERSGNIRLHTGSWNGAQSRNANAFGHLHSDGHEDLFLGHSVRCSSPLTRPLRRSPGLRQPRLRPGRHSARPNWMQLRVCPAASCTTRRWVPFWRRARNN